jgi:predicted nucleotidyltransferase
MPSKKDPKLTLTEAFDRAVDVLNEAGASYALIGGFAVAHHGLPRPTRDIDFLVSIPRVQLPTVLEQFRGRGFTFELEKVLGELGKDHLSSIRYGGVRVDLLDAAIPVFRSAVKNAVEGTIHGRKVRIASAEDLMVLKVIASREDDLRDVRGILATQRGRLNLEAIRESLSECCGSAEIDGFERLVSEAGL